MTTKISDLLIGGFIETQFAQDHATTTGLTYGYKSGVYNGGTTYSQIPAGTLTLPDNTVSNVYIDYTTLPTALSHATVASTPTTNIVLCAQVTTSGGVITNVDDLRGRRTFEA